MGRFDPAAFPAWMQDHVAIANREVHEAIDRAGIDWLAVAESVPALCLDARCPVCAAGPATVVSIMAHLNDDHQWTREAIADWMEQAVEGAEP